MSKDDLRSQLHDPDFFLGPEEPPTLGGLIWDAFGTALMLLIVVPIILGSVVMLGFMLGGGVPVWLLLIWLLFFFGKSSTDAGGNGDR